MKLVKILPLIALLSSCMATTTLYRDGKKIADMRGDMTGLDYQDGDTRLRAGTVDHSTATKAQGEAVAGRLTAAGAAASAAALLK